MIITKRFWGNDEYIVIVFININFIIKKSNNIENNHL